MNILNLFGTFLVTSLSLIILKPMACKVGLIDVPGGRKTHSVPTPLIGGVGIYLGTLLVILFFEPAVLNRYDSLLALSAIVLVIGVLDDLNDISVRPRLLCQASVALLMCLLAGNQLYGVGDIFGAGPVALGFMALPVTVFATVGVMNAVNMTDGLDGLSGGMVVIALCFLALTATATGEATLLAFIATLVFSLLGFLALNYRQPWKRPALVYLGDAGSTYLGFVVAWLLIESTQGTDPIIPPVLALWFLAVPLIDTVYLLITRPLRGISAFSAGRDHLHHKLLDLGLSPGAAVSVLYVIGIALAGAALGAWRAGASEAQLFAAFVALFVVYSGSSLVINRTKPPAL